MIENKQLFSKLIKNIADFCCSDRRDDKLLKKINNLFNNLKITKHEAIEICKSIPIYMYAEHAKSDPPGYHASFYFGKDKIDTAKIKEVFIQRTLSFYLNYAGNTLDKKHPYTIARNDLTITNEKDFFNGFHYEGPDGHVFYCAKTDAALATSIDVEDLIDFKFWTAHEEGEMTEKQLIEALHKGIFNANKIYANCSGGMTLALEGIEGFMVANMATEVLKLQPPFLRLEYPVKEARKTSPVKSKGRPKRIFSNSGRLDMAILNPNYQLKFAIEAKCGKTWNDTYDADINRLVSFLYEYNKNKNTETAMQSAIFALFVSGTSTESEEKAEVILQKRFNTWEEKIDALKESDEDIKHCSVQITYGDKPLFAEANIDEQAVYSCSSSMCICFKQSK